MRSLKWLLAASAITFGSYAQAVTIPTGILTDTAVSTVTDDYGWDFLYRSSYGSYATITDVFGGLAEDDWVMLGGINNRTDTFEVAAAAMWGDIGTYTGLNVTHAANGALWYYNGYSMGFAELGGLIRQTTADTYCTTFTQTGCATPGDESKRLSWHTNYVPQLSLYIQNAGVVPTYFGNGWRAGENTGLNNSSAFDMAVLVLGDEAQVPAPPAVALLGLGMLGMTYLRRRQRNTA